MRFVLHMHVLYSVGRSLSVEVGMISRIREVQVVASVWRRARFSRSLDSTSPRTLLTRRSVEVCTGTTVPIQRSPAGSNGASI